MSGRKSKASRRAKDAKHVRLYLYMLKTPAWLSLSCQARCLLIELQGLYNGSNNGELFMSVRAAGTLLRTGTGHASAAFAELADRGFIRSTRKGALAQPGQTGIATAWRLTEYPDDLTGREATKDFTRWCPPDQPAVSKKINRARKAAAARWRLTEENLSVSHKHTQLVNQGERAPNGAEQTLQESGGSVGEPLNPTPAKTARAQKPKRTRKGGGWYGARGEATAWPGPARREVGLTQQQLAERSGVKRPYIAAIERGHRRPGAAIRARLEAALRGATGAP